MDYTNLSRTISYILRHHPEEYNLELDENGFVDINLLLEAINNKKEFNRQVTIVDIDYILNNSDKKRWEIVNNKIRALYGHSIVQKIKHEVKEPPEILYHGTSHRYLDKIFKEGLLPMNRQYVHLSGDIETAIKVGKRRDNNPVILIIDSKKAYNDGIVFYCENDNIWLCSKIDRKYINLAK